MDDQRPPEQELEYELKKMEIDFVQDMIVLVSQGTDERDMFRDILAWNDRIIRVIDTYVQQYGLSVYSDKYFSSTGLVYETFIMNARERLTDFALQTLVEASIQLLSIPGITVAATNGYEFTPQDLVIAIRSHVKRSPQHDQFIGAMATLMPFVSFPADSPLSPMNYSSVIKIFIKRMNAIGDDGYAALLSFIDDAIIESQDMNFIETIKPILMTLGYEKSLSYAYSMTNSRISARDMIDVMKRYENTDDIEIAQEVLDTIVRVSPQYINTAKYIIETAKEVAPSESRRMNLLARVFTMYAEMGGNVREWIN